jgi:hypothetical protein
MMATETAIRRVDAETDGCARCLAFIRRAVLTHDALPQGVRAKLVAELPIFHDEKDRELAYGYNDARPPRFSPTPRDVDNMLPVWAWLCWLKQENNGDRDYKILVSRARNAPWWKLAQRFGKSERQVQRWQDGAVAALYGKFSTEVWAMDLGHGDV